MFSTGNKKTKCTGASTNDYIKKCNEWMKWKRLNAKIYGPFTVKSLTKDYF